MDPKVSKLTKMLDWAQSEGLITLAEREVIYAACLHYKEVSMSKILQQLMEIKR